MHNADYLALVTQWRREDNTPLNLPNSPPVVRAVFDALGSSATRDILDFYAIVGGMENGNPDDRMFELWCLDRVATENAESPWEYVWFADWLISSHLYALRPVSETHSAVYIDHKCDRKTAPEFLTDSVYDFANRLVADPTSVGVIL
jgi:hypothetical protein